MNLEGERIIRLETLLGKCSRLINYLHDTYDERTMTYSIRKIDSDLHDINPVKLSKEITEIM